MRKNAAAEIVYRMKQVIFLFLFQFIFTLKGLLLFFDKIKNVGAQKFCECIMMQKLQFFLAFLPYDEYNNTREFVSNLSYRSPHPKAARRRFDICKRHMIFWFRIILSIFPAKWVRAARPAVRDGRLPSR